MTGAPPDADWREGHRSLARRIAALPVLAARGAAEALEPPVLPAPIERLVTTGIGSSEAHARALASLVAEHTTHPARFLPPSALLTPGPEFAADTLLVFSQGLSPNAQLVLTHAARWRHVVLATAVSDPARLAPLRARGVVVVQFAGEDEDDTLVRVTGPVTGYLCVLRLARALGAAIDVPAARVEPALAAAAAATAGITPAMLASPLAFVVSGTYGELVTNLRLKVLEGMLRPLPPVWDVLHLAHGPFQQATTGPATFLALTRPDAPHDEPLLLQFESMLDPARHTLVRLRASLPSALAVLEHEMQLNALLLRDLAARGIDQVRWPGRGGDAPLYRLAAPPLGRRLGDCTSPELEALVARGCRTAVLPLGSTEQHGPHLPLDTDTRVGDALADRLCAAVGDAVACPTLPVGCASEHLAFAGTLHIEAETLAAVVRDTIRALARHGIARVFVFSAHGGNAAPLCAMLPTLVAACAPVAVSAFTDQGGLMTALHGEGAAAGVAATEAGHHAGEVETSILLALDASRVRTDALTPGLLSDTDDPQSLFYPDLRVNAPEGVVGDPRRADAARGLRYLRVWTDLLVEAYRGEKNSAQTTGTKNP
jgi:creatinine amidohydrolase/Fe(II)-dependent formamide hydrolase-like protein